MQSLQTLIRQLERSPRWRDSVGFRRLLMLWPQIVGNAVAQHSQPSQIKRGVLHVSVSSAAWAQTLTFERLRILDKIHQQIPAIAKDIKEIRFASARWQQLQRRSQPLDTPQLTEHPSWTRAVQISSQPTPKTAADAFHHWSQTIQTQLADQSVCPECRCPCPAQELQRWPACSICMSHHWQSNFSNG